MRGQTPALIRRTGVHSSRIETSRRYHLVGHSIPDLPPAAFRAACLRLGVAQSTGRPGPALDNAATESFHSTLEIEPRRLEHFVNGTRILTPWRQLNSDPFSLLIFGQSSLVVAGGTRPRSRSLSCLLYTSDAADE